MGLFCIISISLVLWFFAAPALKTKKQSPLITLPSTNMEPEGRPLKDQRDLVGKVILSGGGATAATAAAAHLSPHQVTRPRGVQKYRSLGNSQASWWKEPVGRFLKSKCPPRT